MDFSAGSNFLGLVMHTTFAPLLVPPTPGGANELNAHTGVMVTVFYCFLLMKFVM